MRSSTKARINKIYGSIWRKDVATDLNDSKDEEPRLPFSSQEEKDGSDSFNTHQSLIGGPSMDTSSRKDEISQVDVHTQNLQGLVSVQQQQLREQQQELASLRTFMQNHEQRSREMEALVRDLYLDMDLLDIDGVDPSLPNTTTRIRNWFQGMIKRFKISTKSQGQ